MSSLAVGRLGLELEGLELWLAGLFSAAELAAADLLLQLSVSVAKGDDEEAALSSSATTQSPSQRSARPCCDSGDLTVEEEEVGEERVVEASTVLDRRARKRYRRLSDLYAATSPVTSASVSKKKRKRSHHRHDAFGSSSPSGSGWSVEATRYGGDY
ncbi:hypothetical protein ACQ4PT_056019 [Festuca glaucescens]